MRFISADRQTGKTTKLLHWYFEAPEIRYIICVDEQRRHYVLAQAMQAILYNYEQNEEWHSNHELATQQAQQVGLHVLTPERFKNVRGVRLDEEQIAVDDFEDVLRATIGCVPDLAVGSMVIISDYNVEKL